MSRPSAIALACFFVACGGAEMAPPAPPPDPPPPATAVSTAMPPAPPPSAAPAIEAAPPAPLPRATRAFAEVPLPAGAPIVAIHGRGAHDVWLLAENGVVYQHDGKRVIKKHDRPCLARGNEGWPTVFTKVLALRGMVQLLGIGPGPRGSSAEYRATLWGGGRWVCDSDGKAPTEVVAGVDDVGWALRCGLMHMGCGLVIKGGPPAPLPVDHRGNYSPRLGFWLRAADDAWMAVDDTEGTLLRYRGISWRPVAPLGDWRVVDLWPEPDGTAFIALREAKSNGDDPVATRVARWDGRGLVPLATPPSFRATKVIAAGPKEVWFVGAGRAIHQWDGRELRLGEAPFEVKDAWGAPESGVWIVGGGEQGRAARLAPLGERP
jgi:hypothetical protein